MIRIYYANLLVLNSSMNDSENIVLVDGLNILENLVKIIKLNKVMII